MSDQIKISRECEVVEIPGGGTHKLAAGTVVSITQQLGGSYTLLVPSHGGLFRLAGRDADAIGQEAGDVESPPDEAGEGRSPEELEKEVWARLKTCFDPEIPVNIVDLGLIYGMKVAPIPEGGNRVDIQMTLTAQGCGMGPSIAADAKHKIEEIPEVADADVQVVWDPPWSPDKMSPEAKSTLGIG